MEHDHDYEFEKSYWGDCTNTFDEERKQYVYARYMGLKQTHFSFDVENKTILDVGGGPSSLLLKTTNLREGRVIDPIKYPDWTIQRYRIKNISVNNIEAEFMREFNWDEVWMYNCLQHVIDPALIIKNCKKASKVFRIFEWINIPPHPGHPHELTETSLNNWIGQKGNVVVFSQETEGCFGTAYFGSFVFG